MVHTRAVNYRRHELAESWKRTGALLVGAHGLLPGIDSEPIVDRDEDAYQEYLDHNELKLAMVSLERVALRRRAPKDFWETLAGAADEMKLVDEAKKYRSMAR